MPRESKEGPEYSREREIKVILEDMQSSIRVFGEGLNDVRENLNDVRDRVIHLEEDVSIIKTDVAVIKSIIPTLATKKDLAVLDHRLIVLESK